MDASRRAGAKKSNLRGPMRGTTNKDKTEIKLEKVLNAAD